MRGGGDTWRSGPGWGREECAELFFHPSAELWQPNEGPGLHSYSLLRALPTQMPLLTRVTQRR